MNELDTIVQNGGIGAAILAVGAVLGRAFLGTNKAWDRLFQTQASQIKDLIEQNHKDAIAAATERGQLLAEIAEIRRQRAEDRAAAEGILAGSKLEARQCADDYRRLEEKNRELEQRLLDVERICREQHAVATTKTTVETSAPAIPATELARREIAGDAL